MSKAVLLFILRGSRRIGVTVAGGAVSCLGLIMLVTPGPGLLVIIAGLAILATEYRWARATLVRARVRAVRTRDAVKEKRERNRATRSQPPLG